MARYAHDTRPALLGNFVFADWAACEVSKFMLSKTGKFYQLSRGENIYIFFLNVMAAKRIKGDTVFRNKKKFSPLSCFVSRSNL